MECITGRPFDLPVFALDMSNVSMRLLRRTTGCAAYLAELGKTEKVDLICSIFFLPFVIYAERGRNLCGKNFMKTTIKNL